MSVLRRLLLVAAVVFAGTVMTLPTPVIGLAFAQGGPPFTPPGPPPTVPPGNRGVPAPLLGAGWPAIALAGAAFAAYRLRQRKRSEHADEGAAESPRDRT